MRLTSSAAGTYDHAVASVVGEVYVRPVLRAIHVAGDRSADGR
jgi:hypothetical protein